uniref:Uncharacterized protein n=1 Tax=Anguilla anguilla TaxID=7936 RepID=A0A0E9QSN6_ANGAN
MTAASVPHCILSPALQAGFLKALGFIAILPSPARRVRSHHF